ncbi:endonuclease MutS2 [Abditibacteriota bacterium]|nr:endonuclease MutS2 [Abditibacteriota bacterium]
MPHERIDTSLFYHPRPLERLELPKVLKRLEGHCACDLGRERVHKLRAANSNIEARRRLAVTSEARRFVDSVRFPPFGGIRDITDSLKSAQIGSTLEQLPLLEIGRFAEGARQLRRALRDLDIEQEAQFPLLLDLSEGLFPHPELEKAIFESIDDNGEVKDEASLDLRRARANMRQAQTQVQSRLRSMLSDPRVTPHLQDAFITMRDGRYCLPVKAESRGSVRGIVHDRSGSGNAVFIEPQEVVDLNNRIRELVAEEREAILDVLRGLSALAGGAADELLRTQDAAGELDFAFAKAHLSLRMEGIEPALRDDVAGWDLKRARHPLVEGCVPNDIRLGDESAATERGDFDVMMLTGPNTGGKTIVLKVIGLLTAMTGCGLHIPVDEGSWLHLPKGIHVDIGDEQSIEQSLSTFSGHLKNIVGILKRVEEGDLVLFDEIGAGTDPDEGAALAKAVLRALSRRGARVVATTHYGELKQFALSAQRFENASVEFDPVSLRPTYHLRIGVPGASNALDIAARLGMPGDLIGRARRYLGSDRIDQEAISQRLEQTQRELQSQIGEAEKELATAERLRREYEGKLGRVEREAQKEIEKARSQARELVEAAQKEADEALRELRRAARESGGAGENKGTEDARGRLRTLRERVRAFGDGEAPIQQRVQLPKPPTTPKFGDTLEIFAPKVGQMVRVKSLDREGEVVSVDESSKKIEVRVGAMRLALKPNEITAPRTTGAVSTAGVQSRKTWTVGAELNLIGYNTEDALDELSTFLDDALLADKKEIRVVHGRGTGVLRGAIHKFLRGARGVSDFELAALNEGGEGATVVRLG